MLVAFSHIFVADTKITLVYTFVDPLRSATVPKLFFCTTILKNDL